MDKPAVADYPLHDIIRDRWSPRAFEPRTVSKESLAALFEAARWAPSCFNAQPWSFLVAPRDEEAQFGRLLACLVPGNQVWARNAGALAISVARTTYEHNGKTNRYAEYDTGQAVSYLTFQAAALGIRVHQMAGFDPAKAIETFGIPEGFKPVSAIAIGYDGDPETLPEAVRKMELAPRIRKTQRAFVFSGQWDRPRTEENS